MRTTPPLPGRELLAQVRAAFILRGTTMTAWAKSAEIHPSHLRQALLGSWDGVKGRAVRASALNAAGLTSDERRRKVA